MTFMILKDYQDFQFVFQWTSIDLHHKILKDFMDL